MPEDRRYKYYCDIKNRMNELIYKKKNRVTDVENKLMVTKGESGEKDKLGDCD